MKYILEQIKKTSIYKKTIGVTKNEIHTRLSPLVICIIFTFMIIRWESVLYLLFSNDVIETKIDCLKNEYRISSYQACWYSVWGLLIYIIRDAIPLIPNILKTFFSALAKGCNPFLPINKVVDSYEKRINDLTELYDKDLNDRVAEQRIMIDKTHLRNIELIEESNQIKRSKKILCEFIYHIKDITKDHDASYIYEIIDKEYTEDRKADFLRFNKTKNLPY